MGQQTKDGWVHKTKLLATVRKETKKSQGTIYKWWEKVEEYFDTNRINKQVYIKLKEEET